MNGSCHTALIWQDSERFHAKLQQYSLKSNPAAVAGCYRQIPAALCSEHAMAVPWWCGACCGWLQTVPGSEHTGRPCVGPAKLLCIGLRAAQNPKPTLRACAWRVNSCAQDLDFEPTLVMLVIFDSREHELVRCSGAARHKRQAGMPCRQGSRTPPLTGSLSGGTPAATRTAAWPHLATIPATLSLLESPASRPVLRCCTAQVSQHRILVKPAAGARGHRLLPCSLRSCVEAAPLERDSGPGRWLPVPALHSLLFQGQVPAQLAAAADTARAALPSTQGSVPRPRCTAGWLQLWVRTVCRLRGPRQGLAGASNRPSKIVPGRTSLVEYFFSRPSNYSAVPDSLGAVGHRTTLLDKTWAVKAL